jgi:aromatic ring hydroxylase
MDCINTIGTTYDEAAKPEFEDLMTAVSSDGEKINRFTTFIRTQPICTANRI